jgi:hypothetical protein
MEKTEHCGKMTTGTTGLNTSWVYSEGKLNKNRQYIDYAKATSGLSVFYLWIKTLETDTGIRRCELPIYRFL